MTVKELKEVLKDVPDNATLSFASAGDNPYDDFWKINSIIMLTDIVNNESRVYFVKR